MRKHLIYIIKNKVNEKVYIGQTVQDMNERFRQHLKPSTFKKRGTYKIYNAMSKYGKENFYIELVENEIPSEIIDDKEIFYINKFNSYLNGYNSTNGGDSKTICKVNDLESLKEMFSKGMSYQEIANKFGVSKATIQRTLHSIGIRKNRIVTKEFLMEHKDTMTNIQIANKFNVSPATVSREFKRFGISRGKGCSNKLMPQNKPRKISNK